MNRIGFIGGSGLYELKGLNIIDRLDLVTPFGVPSSEFTIGSYGDNEFVFLPRHGKRHEHYPSNINYRANIYGMKQLCVSDIYSLSAVGSMKLKLRVEDIVVPDQIIDMTRNRKNTFFDDGISVHCSIADPICLHMFDYLSKLFNKLDYQSHTGGVYICIEGPQFSSRAESFLYKSWGVDIIGMTNATEAKLCREAEICYSSITFITDYDCWHSQEEDVLAHDVLKVLKNNADKGRNIIKNIMETYIPDHDCKCKNNLATGIITRLDDKNIVNKEKYGLLLEKYIG